MQLPPDSSVACRDSSAKGHVIKAGVWELFSPFGEREASGKRCFSRNRQFRYFETDGIEQYHSWVIARSGLSGVALALICTNERSC
ncbi:hypothetical protein HWI79_2743 [Cryptosporidium felis]|nr:hypothetical protein HWI79_2743 [Cryptosporidium felis]